MRKETVYLPDGGYGKPNIQDLQRRRDIRGLLEALKHEDEGVREYTAEALGNLGDRTAVEPLCEALKDNSWRVRMWAAWALGKLRDEKAVDPLIKALNDDTVDVRRLAADALSGIGESAIAPVINVLAGEDEDLSARAEYVLWNIGNASILPLIKALQSGNWRVRMWSAIALGRINYKRVNDPPNVILDPKSIFCLETKIELPASKRDEAQAVEPLIKALEDNEPIVRRNVAFALGRIGDKRAIEPLKKMLNDSDEMVRKNAEQALKIIQTGAHESDF